MKKIVSTFLVLWVVWIVLSGFDISNVIIGGVASLIIAFVIAKYVNYSFDLTMPVKLLKFVFMYAPVFLVQLIIANFDMAYRVLSPKLPINPGFVRIPIHLKGDMGRLTLANSITLTPGTLTLDVEEDELYIHWVNVKGNSTEAYRKEICGSFQKILGGIFND